MIYTDHGNVFFILLFQNDLKTSLSSLVTESGQLPPTNLTDIPSPNVASIQEFQLEVPPLQ